MANKQPSGNYAIIPLKFEEHKLPIFKEEKRLEYILFGENNDYPNYLIELAGRSSTHNALLTGKAQYIRGEGFAPVPGLESFMANNGTSINEVLYRSALDLEMFNGFALQIDFGVVGGKVARVTHLDFSYCRKDKAEENILYCDWTDSIAVKRGEWQVLPIWGATNNQPKRGSYVVYYCGYRPNFRYYPIPEYVGAVPAIETDVEINNYHLNNIKNGFTAGTLINFNNGVPPDEKKKEVERKLKAKFSGTDRAGGIIINFSDSPDKKPDILPLQPNDLDKQFEQLRKDTVQEIFIGHKITSPVIFGISTPGALGQRNEMLDAFEIFQRTYISNRQAILERVFSVIAGINGGSPSLKILPFKLFADNAPVQPQQPTKMSVELNPEQIKCLTVLGKQPLLDDTQLAVLIGVEIERIKNVVSSLVQNGMMTVTLTPGGDLLRLLTDVGRAQVDLYKGTFSMKMDDARLFEVFESFAKSSDTFSILRHKFYELTKEDVKALEVIKDNPGASGRDIAKALNISEAEANDILTNLVDKGILNENVINDTTTEHEITKEGKTAIRESDLPIKTIHTYYAYDKSPEATGGVLLPTSREFCKKMVALTDTSKSNFKLFDREGIDKLSDLLGYDVWAERGGWWTRKGTDQATPYCRHIWKSVRVVKK